MGATRNDIDELERRLIRMEDLLRARKQQGEHE